MPRGIIDPLLIRNGDAYDKKGHGSGIEHGEQIDMKGGHKRRKIIINQSHTLQMRHKFSVNRDEDSRERMESLEGWEGPSVSRCGGSRIAKSSLNGPCSVTGVRLGPGW